RGRGSAQATASRNDRRVIGPGRLSRPDRRPVTRIARVPGTVVSREACRHAHAVCRPSEASARLPGARSYPQGDRVTSPLSLPNSKREEKDPAYQPGLSSFAARQPPTSFASERHARTKTKRRSCHAARFSLQAFPSAVDCSDPEGLKRRLQ